MNEKEALLQQLSDIAAPDPVGLWPLAPGWWILIVLILLTIGLSTYAILKYLQRTRYRKQALKILKRLEADSHINSREKTLENLLGLLKRTALTAYKHSRSSVANLYGRDFFYFLEATLDEVPLRIESKWHNALYQKSLLQQADFPLDKILRFTRLWIQKHQQLDATAFAQRLQKLNGEQQHG